MAKKPAKTETLTLRLDPKTRFMLEFVARLRGQTITTVFERAIQDTADQATITDPENGYDYNWKSFWDIEDGVRAIKIAQDEQLRPSYEEEKMLAFTKKFWPFFYGQKHSLKCNTFLISILWPNIQKYMEVDEEQRLSDYWAAGKLMQKDLEKAGIDMLNWVEMIENAAIGDFKHDTSSDVPF